MNVLRRKYYIYPEIQKPLIKQIAISLILVCVIQCLFIFLSMKWLESKVQAEMSIFVDYRVLGPWKNLLYFSIFIPIVMNFTLGLFFILYISNKFAGPLFRLERELDLYLSDQKKDLVISFRTSDYLLRLAEKINLIPAKVRDVAEERKKLS